MFNLKAKVMKQPFQASPAKPRGFERGDETGERLINWISYTQNKLITVFLLNQYQTRFVHTLSANLAVPFSSNTPPSSGAFIRRTEVHPLAVVLAKQTSGLDFCQLELRENCK